MQVKYVKVRMEKDDNDDYDSNYVLLMVTSSYCTKSDHWYFYSFQRMMKFTDSSSITVEGTDKVLI